MSKWCVKRWKAIANVLKPFYWSGKANSAFVEEPNSLPLKGVATIQAITAMLGATKAKSNVPKEKKFTQLKSSKTLKQARSIHISYMPVNAQALDTKWCKKYF